MIGSLYCFSHSASSLFQLTNSNQNQNQNQNNDDEDQFYYLVDYVMAMGGRIEDGGLRMELVGNEDRSVTRNDFMILSHSISPIFQSTTNHLITIRARPLFIPEVLLFN